MLELGESEAGSNIRLGLAAGGTVDLEDGAGDVAGKVAGEEEEGVSDVTRLTDAAEGDGLDEGLNHFGGEFGDHVGVGDAGGDSVDADVRRG